jgi:hypothetical protein
MSSWPGELYNLLRNHDVTQFAYVPDAGHKMLIDRSLGDPDVDSIALTTEEEGVAMLAGAGIKATRLVAKEDEIVDASRLIREADGTAFVCLRVKATDPPSYRRAPDPAACRNRFRSALLGRP